MPAKRAIRKTESAAGTARRATGVRERDMGLFGSAVIMVLLAAAFYALDLWLAFGLLGVGALAAIWFATIMLGARWWAWVVGPLIGLGLHLWFWLQDLPLIGGLF